MKHESTSHAQDNMQAACHAQSEIRDDLKAPNMSFDVICHDAAGNEKWRETIHNTVMTAGKTDILDKYLKGSSYTAAWFMLLKGSGTISAADTLASHAGWTEITAYSGNRPAITWGSTSAGSNTGTGVVFTMNAGYTVAGAGCATVATGTSGVLYDMADFGTARTGASGDTITVTPTLSVS